MDITWILFFVSKKHVYSLGSINLADLMTVVYFSNSFTGTWQCQLNDNSCKKKSRVWLKNEIAIMLMCIFFSFPIDLPAKN